MSDDFPPLAKALAIVPKVFAVPSILGSAYILREVLRSKKKRGETYQRLMAAMSCSDIIGSIGAFLGTWPIPVGTPGVYMASGTTQTCIAAGFFNQLAGPCTPMYNGALGIYYVCKIRYNWPDQRIKQVEMMCHAVILSIGFSTSIAGLPLKLYNNADNWVCWIGERPLGCLDSHRYPDDANCERGDNAWIYQWAWFYSLGWASFIVMTGSLAIVYRSVLRVEMGIDAYDVTGERRRDNSNAVFWQGVSYCFAFMITWFFSTLTRILFLVFHQVYIPVLFLLATFWPLQGFWNCLIYLRPRYLKYRKRHPDGTFCHMVSKVLHPVHRSGFNTTIFGSAFTNKSKQETGITTKCSSGAAPIASLDPYHVDDVSHITVDAAGTSDRGDATATTFVTGTPLSMQDPQAPASYDIERLDPYHIDDIENITADDTGTSDRGNAIAAAAAFVTSIGTPSSMQDPQASVSDDIERLNPYHADDISRDGTSDKGDDDDDDDAFVAGVGTPLPIHDPQASVSDEQEEEASRRSSF